MRRLSSRSPRNSSSAAEYSRAMKPPSRASTGRSAASARVRRSTSSEMLAEIALGAGEERRHALAAHEAAQGRGFAQRVAQARQIARAAAPQRQPRHRARHVGGAAQEVADVAAQALLASEEGDRVEPLVDRGAVCQRRREMRCEEARAGAGDAAVDGREQAALALAGEGLAEFEIAPRRRVDLQERARGELARWQQRRHLALLRQRDVIDERARSRQLGAAEIAEAVEHAYAVERLEPLAPVLAVEARIRERRERALPFAPQLEEVGTLDQPFGQ